MVERKITFTEDFVLSERDGATDTEVFKIDTTGGNTIDCKVGRLAVNPPPAGEPPTAIDALIDFNNSTTRWVLGLDADDAGRFKLAVGSSLSATTLLEVGDVDGEGVTIYSKDATETSHAVLKINSSAADAQLTFTGPSSSWSMGHDEGDDAFFITAGASLSAAHIAQYDSPGNDLGWDFLGNKARFRDTTGAADGRVEIVPEDGGDAYISFIGDGETFSLGNYAYATDRFRLTKSAGLTSSLIIDGGTDIFEFFLTTEMRIKHAVGSTDGYITLNPSDAAAAYIAFTGTNSTWSAGIDTADNFTVSEAQGFGGTNRFVIRPGGKFDFTAIDETNDCNVSLSTPAGSNKDPFIRFSTRNDEIAYSLGQDYSQNQSFRLTNNSDLTGTILFNYSTTGVWEFYASDKMQVKSATSDTSGWVTINPSSNADAFISFVGGQTWSVGVDDDADDNFKIAKSHALGTTDVISIRNNLERIDFTGDQITFGHREGTTPARCDFLIEASGTNTITDPQLRFGVGVTNTQYTLGIDNSSDNDDLVLSASGVLGTDPIANCSETGHWVFSCPVDSRDAAEQWDSSMTFWFNEGADRLQFAVKDSAGATHTGHVVMDD